MRITVFLLFFVLVTLVFAQDPSKEKNPDNFIEDISENYTLNVEKLDVSVEIKVYVNNERLYETTITS